MRVDANYTRLSKGFAEMDVIAQQQTLGVTKSATRML